MNSEIYQPIDTSIGQLQGRDAIYLNWLNFDVNKNILVLEGTINGNLASNTPKRWLDFNMTFDGVYALRTISLDLWLELSSSNFDLVVNSSWLIEQNAPDDSKKHFVVKCYDDVVEVIAECFKLEIVKSEDR